MKPPDPKWNWLFPLWSPYSEIPKKDEASKQKTGLVNPALVLILRNVENDKVSRLKTELIIPIPVPRLRNPKGWSSSCEGK